MIFKRISNRLKSKSKTKDEKKFKDNTVEDVTNENNVAPLFRIMPFASSHSQRFDDIDELQVSTFSDMNTSLMNLYSDPLQASMHYANRFSTTELQNPPERDFGRFLERAPSNSQIMVADASLQSLVCVQGHPSQLALRQTHHGSTTTESPPITESRIDPVFESAFSPHQLRCLALISHVNMKDTMAKFVETHKNVLSKFRLTGTESTMMMVKEAYMGRRDVVFGPTCKHGILGGYAELATLMCNGNLGGIIFFKDPLASHPDVNDIECLIRQAQIYNVMIAVNPTSAIMLMSCIRESLRNGRSDMIPSFLFSLQSPAVKPYKEKQLKVLAHSKRNGKENTRNNVKVQ